LISFSITTKIARPPRDVFAFLADPENLREWQGTHEVEQLGDGPLGVGTRFREVHLAPGGKRIESITEITECEPDRVFAVRIVEGPIPIDGRWELEATDAGTKLTFTAFGRGPGPAFLQPIVAVGAKRQFKRQHKKLRTAIEARPPTPEPAGEGPPAAGPGA
jgi:uncharacterized protein YndB with AHSA1/START domain